MTSASTRWRRANPERARAQEALRLEAKNRWARENYRGTCEVCGVSTSRPFKTRCPEHGAQRVARQAKAERVVELWAEGRTLSQIASAIGTTPGSLAVLIHRLRREGYDLPYRRRPERLRGDRATA